MRYANAADILPEALLSEIQKYINGSCLYIPAPEKQQRWGEKTGARQFYQQRNAQIRQLYQEGQSLEQIAACFGLAYDTVRKIAYKA